MALPLYPIDVGPVVAALGGAEVLGNASATLGELADAVLRGLPRGVVGSVAMAAAPPLPALRQKVAR